jgi:peroxiredoxin
MTATTVDGRTRVFMKKSSLYFLLRHLALMALLAATLKASAQTAPPPAEIAIGEHAPSFTLKDQNDREISLDKLLKKGPVAVVFIRSVEWCVYCQLQTIQLTENLQEIQAAGGQVVIITYDAPEKVKRFTDARKLTVPILSDPGSKTIDAYAMRGLQASGDQVGSARHGTFVIDPGGIIRSKPYLTSFEGHAAVDALVGALKEAGKSTPESRKP